jgi:hypothetical protein
MLACLSPTTNATSSRSTATASQAATITRGLILTTNRRFPRGQPATTGKLVVALEEFLNITAPAIMRNPSFVYWLQ